MVSNVLNVMKSLRNLSESNEFETNARADVKYQYETFKYSSKSPATTQFIGTEGALRLPTTYDNQSHPIPSQSNPFTKAL